MCIIHKPELFIHSLINTAGFDSIVHTNLIIYSQFNSIFGGISNNTIGGGFFSGSQYLELSCYETSSLVSAVVYSQDTSLTTFEVRDDNGNILKDTTINVIPGGHRIYFNYEMLAGTDYELGVNGTSDNLFRNDTGVTYPYNFASSAAITSSSAGGQYYYFFYDVEITPNMTINTVRICDGESITINGNVYAATGVYTDIYSSFNGCDSIVETNLTIDSAVTAQITQNGVNIEANVNGGTSPYSYIWSSGETSQSITPLANGSYWVTATDTNGCISDTAFYMVTFIPSGVDDILNSDINIYPNPTDGLIHINSDLKIEKIELFSVEGKLLKTTTEVSILLDVQGIYFIKIITEQGNIMKRVVVN